MTAKPAPATAGEVPVQEMVVLHRIFRREFPLLASAVRRCMEGDARWAQGIGEHADFIISALHNHHTAEDEYLWPVLLERAQPHASLVRRMEEQHLAVADPLARAGQLLAEWRRAPARAAGDELATALTQVHESLAGHLDEEEATILPLISEHIMVAEWEDFGQRSFEKFPKSALPVMLGQMLESATPAEAELFLRKLPAFVPVMWRLVWHRGYDRYIRRVRGLDRPAMRRWMRRANKLAAVLYRRSGGRIGGSAKGMRVLLLTVPGRNTGTPHAVPVGYLEHEGCYMVMGTSGGTRAEPQWFRNIRAAQQVHVRVGTRHYDMKCRVASSEERDRLWHDVVLTRHPFFQKYEDRAGRIIPIALLWQ